MDSEAPPRTALPWLLVLIGAIAFANGLGAPFLFDDVNAIENNPHLRHLWPIGEALTAEPQTPLAGRPVASLTMAVNHALGGLDPRGYRAVNLAIHLLAALALFGVVRRTLAGPRLAGRFGPAAGGLAFATALIWMVHPLQGECVNYLTQRTESLMGLFYLLALLAAIRAGTARGRWTWSVLAVVACGLGMASKESMVTAPLMVVLYDMVFREEPPAAVLRRRWGLYAGLAATWVLLAALMLPGPRSATVGFGGPVSPLTYALDQCRMISAYLRLAFWPSPLSIDYGAPRAITITQAAPYLAVVAVLLATTALALRYRPAAGFAGAWIFLILAPTSSLVPIATEVGAERRMYLPLAGLVALVVGGTWILLRPLAAALPPALVRDRGSGERAGRAAGALGMVLLVAAAVPLFLATVRRNRTFHDPVALWQTAAAVAPDSPRAHNNLANALQAADRLEEAREEYERAIALREELDLPPDQKARGLYNMGRVLHRQNRLEEAIRYYRQSLLLAPDPNPHNNLGLALEARGDLDHARDEFGLALTLDPNFARAYANLGRVTFRQGDLEAAANLLDQALVLEPDLAEAHAVLSQVLASQGHFETAIAHARRGLATRPDDADLHYSLGYALQGSGRVEKARGEFERALALDPRHAEAHNGLGSILGALGRTEKAIAQFRRAVELDPALVSARNNLGSMLGATGHGEEAVEQLREAVRLAPDSARAVENLGLALVSAGRYDEAARMLEEAIRRWPRRPASYRSLAWLLLNQPDHGRRDPTRALKLANRAGELTSFQDPQIMSTLAAAYAAAGAFDAAVNAARGGLEAARAAGNTRAAKQLKEQLRRYASGRR